MTGTWRYQWWTHVLLDEFSVRLEQLHHNNMLETCLLQNSSTCMKFIEILVVSCSTTVCYHCARLWVRPSVSSAALTQQPDVSASPVTIRWAQDFAELQVTGLEQFHSQVRGNAAASRTACSGACDAFHLQSFYMPGKKGQSIGISKNFDDFCRSEDVYGTYSYYVCIYYKYVYNI